MDQKSALLKQVHDAVLNPELLQSLIPYREEVLLLLDHEDLEFTDTEQEQLSQRPGTIADFYAFLAGGEELTTAEAEALDTANELRAADEKSIGRLFKNGLCRDLGHLADPTPFFASAGLSPTASDVITVLESRTDVVHAQPAIQPFVRYGLTPTSVYLTCDAPRTYSMRQDLSDTIIIVQNLPSYPRPGEVSVDAIAREAAWLDDGDPPYYRALLEWLIEVHRSDPSTRQFLFRGFSAVLEGDDLRLSPTGGDQGPDRDTLELQWSPESQLVFA